MDNKTLIYTSPAREWIEGMPFGNGSQGVILYGEPGQEVFSFNHEWLWRDDRHKRLRTADIVQEMRSLVLNGQTEQAERLFKDRVRGEENDINAFQPVCDLELSYVPGSGDYRRSLDLSRGIGQLENGDTHIECFASRVFPCISIRVRHYNRKDMMLRLSRPRDPDCAEQIEFSGEQLKFQGSFPEGTVFQAVFQVQSDAQTAQFDGRTLCLKSVAELVLTVSMEVRYSKGIKAGDAAAVHRAAAMAFEEHRERHGAAHQAVFNRVALTLDGAEHETAQTEAMFQAIYAHQEPSLAFYTQYFYTSRYLAMASSYGAELPANLQGVWNHDPRPQWESSYTMDMNVQMVSWMNCPMQLSECDLPLFRWIFNGMQQLEQACRDLYGVPGIHIPQYTDVWFEASKCEWAAPFQCLWSGAAAWIGQHFLEYWKYTGDDVFLREQAYPYLLQCAAFYEHFLVKDQKGAYILCPSSSPENETASKHWLVNTATMDLFLIEELLSNLLRIEDYLSLRSGRAERWKEILANLTAYPVDRDGVLREWVEDSEPLDPFHRHLSHIYGLFPGKLLHDPARRDLAKSVEGAIERRISSGGGSFAIWSYAWYACCFARLGQGDRSLEYLDQMIDAGMLPNFFTTHNDWRESGKTNHMIAGKLFQIEACLGGAAAIAEYFLQSFDDEILILPALPSRWAKGGSISGLCSYQGAVFKIEWERGAVRKMSVYFGHSCELKLRFPKHQPRQYNEQACLDDTCSTVMAGKHGETKTVMFHFEGDPAGKL